MAPSSSTNLIHSVIRPEVQAMASYVVQPSAGMVKLDAMENPFSLSPALQDELGRRLAQVALNRYPGSRLDDLRGALAEQVDLPDGFDVLLGNGSDELISLITLACARPGATVLAPVPGFVMYEVSAQLHGLKFIGVPLTTDFQLDESALLDAMAEHQPAVTYIAYPNNPTANLFDDGTIERVIQASSGLVIIDEAYQPFASRTFLSRLSDHEHVLVLRTLSKFGLAGIRLGYLLGRSALIAQIDKVRPPYNVSVLNAETALFALEHTDEFARQAQTLRQERTRLSDALSVLPGVQVHPSEANMILVRVPDAPTLFSALKDRHVLVKDVSSHHPLLAHCLRLTVGTPEENDLLIDALKVSLP